MIDWNELSEPGTKESFAFSCERLKQALNDNEAKQKESANSLVRLRRQLRCSMYDFEDAVRESNPDYRFSRS